MILYTMPKERCGRSGLVLPAMSLGFWHSFGRNTAYAVQRDIVLTAFDSGIYHFDNANCYGPPNGEAEIVFGRIFREELRSHRDEILIATKAGAPLGNGVYQSGGSRKHLISQLDQSLRRLGLDYVDIFYHHRPDLETDLQETASALSAIVHSGKALYIGVSNYSVEELQALLPMLDNAGTPCVICQSPYSMLKRSYVSDGLMDLLQARQIGSIAYSVLAQGILTGKYNNGIPADSRLATDGRYIHAHDITQSIVDKTTALEKLAQSRGQTLSQMALVWAQKTAGLTSVLIGASKPEQVIENINALQNREFSTEELLKIDEILR